MREEEFEARKRLEKYVEQNRKKFGGKWALLFNSINLLLLIHGSCLLIYAIFLFLMKIEIAFLLMFLSVLPLAFLATKLSRKVANKFAEASEKAKEDYLQKFQEDAKILEKGGIQ